MKAAQGCWTCKRRKIGCDKALPSCNNCLRSKRHCMGYDIRLVWPDSPDGRRKTPQLPEAGNWSAPETAHYGRQFLNHTTGDVSLARDTPFAGLVLRPEPLDPPPARALSCRPDLKGSDADLLSYYDQRIARMISTIDISNGFRVELIPMALSSSAAASRGLREAILALAASHRYGSNAALPYKANALRLLFKSLVEGQATDCQGTIETQLAASMMLCVYNVFDESEGYWHLHLNGARNLLHKLAQSQGQPLQYRFLYTWFLYHEILGAFSQPYSALAKGVSSINLLYDESFDKSTIVGSLGCSMEVLEIIHCINTIRSRSATGLRVGQRRRNEETDPALLETRLFDMSQRLDDKHAGLDCDEERNRILTTAEFYRLATVLYLFRVSPSDTAIKQRASTLDKAFELLSSLKICTSPWPLFVVACEATSDEQRISILLTLDRMDEARKIGNVFVLRDIIESFWKRQDLQEDKEHSHKLQWWDPASINTTSPWFI